MQNEVWQRIGQFLNELRCENVRRDTAVEVAGYNEAQNKVEKLQNKCETILERFPEKERNLFLEWIEAAEIMNSMEGQKAYCQGYVDCILLLSGMGLLKPDLSGEELVKWVKHQ